jgi:hypothetical protein
VTWDNGQSCTCIHLDESSPQVWQRWLKTFGTHTCTDCPTRSRISALSCPMCFHLWTQRQVRNQHHSHYQNHCGEKLYLSRKVILSRTWEKRIKIRLFHQANPFSLSWVSLWLNTTFLRCCTVFLPWMSLLPQHSQETWILVSGWRWGDLCTVYICQVSNQLKIHRKCSFNMWTQMKQNEASEMHRLKPTSTIILS